MSGLEPLLVMSTVATVVGTGLSAAGSIAAGEARAKQAQNEATVRRWQAKQMEMQGKEEEALAQRKGQEYARQKRFALSKLQARSSASGFSATDPTTLNLAGDIEEYGTYQQQMAQYGGTVKRRDLELGAGGSRYSAMMSDNMADAYRTTSYLDAGGTIAQGAGSIFAKYAPVRTPSRMSMVNQGWGYVPTYD